MENNFDVYSFDTVNDICYEYETLKESGAEADVDKIILENNAELLLDFDDEVWVYIALALCHLKDQTPISSELKQNVSNVVESPFFVERFTDTGNEKLIQSFYEWKTDFLKQVNGEISCEKNVKKTKRLPKMNPGDIFEVSYENGELKDFGRIFLIIIEHKHFIKKSPVFYLALARKSEMNLDEISAESFFFLPVSCRYEHYDYRRILLDRVLDAEINLTFVKNVADVPHPVYESIPPEPSYYGLQYLETIKSDVHMGIKILKHHWAQ